MVMASASQSAPPHATRTIPAGEFKAKCLQLMDEVNDKKLTLIITKRGKPVSQVTAPAPQEKPFRSIIGRSPGIRIPPDFEELRAKLALDWADPGEKWARANGGRRSKKR
jgi:prevent-host-death family protein